ncbi:MAG: T9SS type A sorting domain-containing protein [Bacteroidales bacterium]|nr:T9SS type A sorting domain-containing protein [Bacteroidales bacterium]
MKHSILFLFIFFVVWPFPAHCNVKGDFDVTHYEIRLDVLDFTTKVIHGQTTVTFVSNIANLNSIELELRQLGIDSVFFESQKISSFSHSADNLAITFPNPVAQDDTVAVTVFYHGIPFSESWGGFHFSGQYAFNLGVGFETYPPNLGKAWFPCADDFYDRALFDFHIRITDNKQASCGGLLQEITSHGDGTHTFHWKMDYNIPTYLASVAIGDYVAVTDTFNGMERDIPIIIYVRPADEWKVAGSFANLQTIMANLEARFGPYPFERIGYSGTALGAMEHAGNVAYPSNYIDNTLTYEWLYTHEISHMWFGNRVTCAGPGEMWLNEGWAVWNELLFREDLYGPETSLITQRSKHRQILQYLHTSQGDGGYHALYNIPPAYVYGNTVYQKGGLVVHTLRNYLGDDLFFPAVQFYLDTFAYHHASSFDLRDVLSQHSGLDLTGFFDSWVFEPGFPHYSIDSFNLTTQGAEVFVRQRGKGRDFLGDANIVEITFMDQNRQIFSDTLKFDGQTGSKVFNIPFEPVIAMMDYNEKICDATTDRAHTIVNTGTIEFADTFSKLLVSSVEDTAFVRITHNWVPPDPLQDSLPGLTLSPYRHWHVDGIIPEGFDSEIHFFYQSTAYIDNDLIINAADSLVILYRPTIADDWQSVPFTRYGPWSVGWIMLDTLRLGEYTLAIWDAMYVGNKEIEHYGNQLNCYPNPSNGKVNISWQAANAGRLQITDLQGKVVDEFKTPLAEGVLNWDAANRKPGIYLATLYSRNNEPIISTKVVIRSGE